MDNLLNVSDYFVPIFGASVQSLKYIRLSVVLLRVIMILGWTEVQYIITGGMRALAKVAIKAIAKSTAIVARANITLKYKF